MVVVLFKRRIAPGIAEKVAEDAIVENTECAADRHLAIALWIPRETDPRFDVRIVGRVELVSRPRSDDRHSDRTRSGVTQQIGEVRVFFVRNAIQLVASAKRQGKVAPYFPRILSEPVVFMLSEILIIRSLPGSPLVKEFSLKIVVHNPVIGLSCGLQTTIVARNILNHSDAKIWDQCA